MHLRVRTSGTTGPLADEAVHLLAQSVEVTPVRGLVERLLHLVEEGGGLVLAQVGVAAGEQRCGLLGGEQTRQAEELLVLVRQFATDLGDDGAAAMEQVRSFGRDPDAVEITLQAMLHPSLDDLKRYRDAGIARVNIGVSVDLWDKPEAMLPMIDEYAALIPKL